MFHDIPGILVLMQARGLTGAGTSRRYEKKCFRGLQRQRENEDHYHLGLDDALRPT